MVIYILVVLDDVSCEIENGNFYYFDVQSLFETQNDKKQ